MTGFLLALTIHSGISISVRVDGEGYLRLVRDGIAVYSKHTRLVDSDGKLTDYKGNPILPEISIPEDTTDLDIDISGNVYAIGPARKASIGRLVLAMFPAGSSLTPDNGVLVAADKPSIASPGEDVAGVIRTDHMQSKRLSGAPSSDPAKHHGAALPQALVPNTAVKHQQTPDLAGVETLGTIEVAPSSTVTGDKILLGKIAKIDAPSSIQGDLESVEIGETPVVGVKKVIERTRIAGRLRAAGFNPEKFSIVMPIRAEVHCECQSIPASKFLIAAIGSLQAKAGAASSWDSPDPLPDFTAPAGTLELRTESMSGVESGHASVVVAVYVDGKRFNSRLIHFNSSSPELMKVPAGAAVKVILTSGHAQVEVPGVTKNSASIGGTVQVEVKVGSPEVKTIHTGTLTQPGIVEVKL